MKYYAIVKMIRDNIVVVRSWQFRSYQDMYNTLAANIASDPTLQVITTMTKAQK